jgi:hypothetical protein
MAIAMVHLLRDDQLFVVQIWYLFSFLLVVKNSDFEFPELGE